MDINLDLARVQARIAELGGAGAAVAAPAAPFASLLGQSERSAPAAMQWPVQGSVTSAFGERKNPLGPGEDFHPGIDIAAESGSPVAAAAAGRVIAAGPEGGYGNLVVLDNGNGVTTRYAHCSQIFARVGEFVSPGQTIAAVGSTGASTGPHLHFEVRVGNRAVDPAQVLP